MGNKEVETCQKNSRFGHKSVDAIGSSVALLILQKEAYGLDTEAVALGTPNETAFVGLF